VASSKTAGPNQPSGTWWTTLPGILTGIAAIVTAFSGLWVALQQTGVSPRPPEPANRDELRGIEPKSPSRSEPEPLDVARARSVGAEPPSAAAPTNAAHIDGLDVTILSAQSEPANGASFVLVQYRVKTGSEPVWHDPINFMKLLSGGQEIASVSTSNAAGYLPSKTEANFAMKFPVASESSQQLRLRLLGSHHRLDIPIQLTQ
jgi:hypothetical protein